jgi:hypothetical protein
MCRKLHIGSIPPIGASLEKKAILNNPLAHFLFSQVHSRSGGFNMREGRARDGRVRASKDTGSKFRSRGSKMRFWLAAAVVLVGISVSVVAQQDNTFKVKPSAPEKPPRTATVPIGKTAVHPATASDANSKDLQALERQSAKASMPPRSAGKTTPGTASALKPVKDQPIPPINFRGNGGSRKTAGTTRQDPNPYAGRVKQKGPH